MQTPSIFQLQYEQRQLEGALRSLRIKLSIARMDDDEVTAVQLNREIVARKFRLEEIETTLQQYAHEEQLETH